jgi:hypothetical protein
MSAPIFLALRRIRARPLSAAGLALAFASAAALIGWSSLIAAQSQEESVRQSLADPATRPFQVRYYTLPLEQDFRSDEVNRTFADFADVTLPPRRIRVSHSIEADNPLGTRLVTAREPQADLAVRKGRLPARCHASTCEVLALRGTEGVGDRVNLGGDVSAIVVGVGSLRAELLPDPSELGSKAFFLRSLPPQLQALVTQHGSTVVTSAALNAREVHGYELDDITSRLRVAITRLQLGDPLVRGTAPFALLRDLAHRGEVARERLLLVAGEGAALILAFATFLAAARRRETELLDDQLAIFGASRSQFWVTRVTEVVTPCAVGVVAAVGGLAIAAATSLTISAGLPLEALVAIVAVAVVGSTLLVTTQSPPTNRRFGVGSLELAALAALGVVAWESATTGALDPDQVAASSGTPVLLLVPALAFFGVGVALLRVVPYALRAAARATRRAPAEIGLAFLTAARNPAQVAAATTFLAVALGASLFSLNYRATLDRQAEDHANFVVGAAWRAPEFRQRGTPVLRLDGRIEDAAAQASPVPATVIGLPADRLAKLRGWRTNLSSLSRPQIARRVRPAPIRMSGLPLSRDAHELRVRASAHTDYPRRLVLHVLHGQAFTHLTLGLISGKRRLLHVRLPRAVRGGQIVGVAFDATYVPISFQYEPSGFVELGPLEERTANGWMGLPSLANWIPSTAPTGTAGSVVATKSGIRFELLGTFQPLIHPRFGLPDRRIGFVTGEVPAMTSEPLARRAVDGLLVLDLEGIQVPVRVVGRARLFPTVVHRPSSFLLFDYDTLFATLNADQPGRAVPSETLFFGTRPSERRHLLGAEQLRRMLAKDPLAAGMRNVLRVAGIVAAVLGLLGLALATRSALGSERLQLAEYEALGVPPTSLRHSAQLRLLALSAFGIVAALLGALLSGRLISAFVAVSGTARRPLPPIASVVDWPTVAVVVAALAASGAAAALLLTRRAQREAPARRLRA